MNRTLDRFSGSHYVDSLIEQFALKKPSKTTFSIEFPSGKARTFGRRKEQFRIQIKSSKVYQAAAFKGFLGIGEQFMLGNLEILGDFDEAMITMATIFNEGMDGNLIFTTIDKLKRSIFPETKDKSLKDVGAHYDLSNDFYAQSLDPTMTYSCGYFKNENDSLEKAQLQKYEHICRKLILKRDETLLDVGCGWGGMLIYAAQKYKIRGYGVTLSKNQVMYAREEIKRLGLQNVLTIELKDYRDVKGQFDKFVSIGMFEHVTEKFYSEFFQMIKNTLKSGGIGVLHTIGNNKTKGNPIDPWLNTYIFPGTYIPSAAEIFKYAAAFDLVPKDLENLNQHYALTLDHWAKNFEKAYNHTINERGEKFARMWRLYLRVCRGSFVAGMTQLWQLTFTNGTTNNYPLTRNSIYRTSGRNW